MADILEGVGGQSCWAGGINGAEWMTKWLVGEGGGPAWLAASRIRITIHYAIKLSMISLTVLEFGLYLTFRF